MLLPMQRYRIRDFIVIEIFMEFYVVRTDEFIWCVFILEHVYLPECNIVAGSDECCDGIQLRLRGECTEELCFQNLDPMKALKQSIVLGLPGFD